MSEKVRLHYPVFDGRQVYEDAAVVIENGKISAETCLRQGEPKSDFLLMPGLIDAHIHLYNQGNVEDLLISGVTATCAVGVSATLQRKLEGLRIWTSRTMALGMVRDGRAYVEREIAAGADYIKVILEKPARMAPRTMEAKVLREIADCAHEHGRKVAAHAVSIPMVEMAVDAGVDILIHVPMTEPFPEELARRIGERGMAVVPTLTMMEAFAADPKFVHYRPEHYPNAEAAVRLLHQYHVPILTGTDSSEVPYVPKVPYGISLQHELQLLKNAGLSPMEVLQGATLTTAEVFGMTGYPTIAPGQPATMILVKGRPDRTITNSTRIVQIWVNGEPLLNET